MRLTLLVVLLFATTLTKTLIAQRGSNLKFEKMTVADFDLKSPVIDSNTNAVVIADLGNSIIEGNTKGWFSLIHKRATRIKILNKNGFAAGSVSIPIYTSQDGEEKIKDIKATTYNLENGTVKQTRLEASGIFKEKLSKNIQLRKFTFPDLKEGSIIEYSYTIESEFLQYLRSWEFQGDYPRLKTEYSVNIPEFFEYVFLSQGQFPLKTVKKNAFKNYSISESNGAAATERYSLSGNELRYTWSAADVPALKEEPYTSSVENYISKIDFQLSRYRFPNTPPKDVLGNWSIASDNLLKADFFGTEITRPNNWLADDVKKITAGASTPMESARAVYAYIRDNITNTRNTGIYFSDNTTLRDVVKKKSGTLPEINMLLIAMLRQLSIPADPVLLSTKENGFASQYYPLLSKYNHLICRTRIDGKTYYLDAGQPRMGFGMLSLNLYNGPGFVVNTDNPANIFFDADSLRESKTTLLFLMNDPEGKGLIGTFSSTPGYNESYSIRNTLASKSNDDFFKETEKGYSFPVKFSDMRVDSLTKFDYPVALKYNMTVALGNDDILYVNPMFSEGADNPFKSADRKYPVEMPCRLSEVFVLNMEIPAGYKIDELPKSTKVSLNENEGSFEYLINTTGNKIMLQSKIDIRKANFAAEDYQTLRDFFGHIAKKHREQIVFKKISP